MTHLWRTALGGLCVNLLATPCARADILPNPPGTKIVATCLRVTNIDAFPGYVVLAYPWWEKFPRRVYFRQVRQNKEVCFDLPIRLYAVQRSEFEEAEIDRAGVETYFERSPRLLRSGGELVPHPYVPAADPGASVTDLVRLTSLDSGTVRFEKTHVIYAYDDKTTEQFAYRSQSGRPKAARGFAMSPIAFLFDNLGAILLAVFGLVSIAAVVSSLWFVKWCSRRSRAAAAGSGAP